MDHFGDILVFLTLFETKNHIPLDGSRILSAAPHSISQIHKAVAFSQSVHQRIYPWPTFLAPGIF